MRMFAPLPVRSAPSRAIRQPRSVQWKIASKRGLLRRFRRLIESGGRVERCICAAWIDGACIGAIVGSALYFLPVLMPLVME